MVRFQGGGELLRPWRALTFPAVGLAAATGSSHTITIKAVAIFAQLESGAVERVWAGAFTWGGFTPSPGELGRAAQSSRRRKFGEILPACGSESPSFGGDLRPWFSCAVVRANAGRGRGRRRPRSVAGHAFRSVAKTDPPFRNRWALDPGGGMIRVAHRVKSPVAELDPRVRPRSGPVTKPNLRRTPEQRHASWI
jgi:hypothetical protein